MRVRVRDASGMTHAEVVAYCAMCLQVAAGAVVRLQERELIQGHVQVDTRTRANSSSRRHGSKQQHHEWHNCNVHCPTRAFAVLL